MGEWEKSGGSPFINVVVGEPSLKLRSSHPFLLSPPLIRTSSAGFLVSTHMPEPPSPPSPPSPLHQHSDREPKMSLSNPTPSASRSYEQEGSSSSSPWRRHTADSFPPPLNIHSDHKHKVEDSDEDMFRVPDVEAQPPSDSTRTTTTTTTNTSNNPEVQQQTSSGKRRRGRNPVDREYRRLKRLLRNRVSAQQARERKKVYVNDLESRAQELQDRNSKLEEKISTLVNENTMLRKVLMNTRPKVDESSSEPKHDQLGKS